MGLPCAARPLGATGGSSLAQAVCTHLEILHSRGLLRALTEHRPLQGVAPAGFQDVIEGTEIWKGEARSCVAGSGVAGSV